MELLDAAIAFALTLAVLATVVTVLMEIVLRCLLMRKRNLVRIMRLLNEELPKGTLGLDEKERWEFFTKVIENPAQGLSERIPKHLGDDASAGEALQRIDWYCLRRGVYDKVSTEHVLRRLSELPRVKQLSVQAADKVKKEFYRLACKYEEFGSAVSASFKRRSQLWSIVFGVGLAIVANVDGIRVFEAFQAKSDLTQTIIARQDQFRTAYDRTEIRKREIAGQEDAVSAAKSALAEAREKFGADSPEVAAALEKLETEEQKLAVLTNPEELRRLAGDAQQQVANLVALGVPIGNAYFPHCRLFGDDDLSTTCAGPVWPPGADSDAWAKRFRFLGYILLWLVPVAVTGMLIGLGAPFWFDVAKRLATVRQMFGGAGSGEMRLAARDANGDPDKRDAIVSRVVDDAAGVSFASSRRLVP
ncbi:MAG: hypothetical protein BMS9Abin01_2346 [Gammaproteobacteria bacterium]|nr:MAG: hypothetical protein BMS9Abin01_2346 [Gammaproteobacteria bacterium]